MKDTDRIKTTKKTDAFIGKVEWQPVKSVWFLSNLLAAGLIAPFFIDLSALIVFVCLTAVTLCFGHSLGMHRLLIHRSYECPKWMEYLFVYLGVLVGMAGPVGMIKQHDLRDWAQRQRKCHDFLLHGSKLFKDGWWQLNCDLKLDNPPKYQIEKEVSEDRFYILMEKTWILQQFVLAIPLYFMGGMSWVVSPPM